MFNFVVLNLWTMDTCYKPMDYL